MWRTQVLPEGLQKELKIDGEKSEIAFRFVAPTTIVDITDIKGDFLRAMET